VLSVLDLPTKNQELVSRLIGNAVLRWANENWNVSDMSELLIHVNSKKDTKCMQFLFSFISSIQLILDAVMQIFVKTDQCTQVFFVSHAWTLLQLMHIIAERTCM
jgi:hypothetical protein